MISNGEKPVLEWGEHISEEEIFQKNVPLGLSIFTFTKHMVQGTMPAFQAPIRLGMVWGSFLS